MNKISYFGYLKKELFLKQRIKIWKIFNTILISNSDRQTLSIVSYLEAPEISIYLHTCTTQNRHDSLPMYKNGIPKE